MVLAGGCDICGVCLGVKINLGLDRHGLSDAIHGSLTDSQPASHSVNQSIRSAELKKFGLSASSLRVYSCSLRRPPTCRHLNHLWQLHQDNLETSFGSLLVPNSLVRMALLSPDSYMPRKPGS